MCRVEEALPMFGLTDDWVGERILGGAGGDTWDAVHPIAGTDHAIRVRTQRRAIHGSGSGGRVTGPMHLIKLDATLDMMLAANEAKLAALRERGGGELQRAVQALHGVASEVARDDSTWQSASLTIDGEPVGAIATTYGEWWVVLHIGIGEIADVYVSGPPPRPDPLALKRVTADVYRTA